MSERKRRASVLVLEMELEKNTFKLVNLRNIQRSKLRRVGDFLDLDCEGGVLYNSQVSDIRDNVDCSIICWVGDCRSQSRFEGRR